MKKWIYFLMSFSLLLLISGCSLLPPEKIVAEQVIVKPTITIVEKPRPIELYNADIVVITEDNLEKVIEETKASSGHFVIYGLTPQSFKNLATSFEEIKRYIQQQNDVILYYEEALTE